MNEEIKCPYCGAIIDNDPFDGDISIEDGHAYSEEHYDCPHCKHWFTAYLNYNLTLTKIDYRKRGLS